MSAGKSFLSPPQYRQFKIQFRVECEHNTTGKQRHNFTAQHCSRCKASSRIQPASLIQKLCSTESNNYTTNLGKQTNQQNYLNPFKKPQQNKFKKGFPSFFPPFSREIDYQSIQRGFQSPRRLKTRAMLLPLHALSSAKGI